MDTLKVKGISLIPAFKLSLYKEYRNFGNFTTKKFKLLIKTFKALKCTPKMHNAHIYIYYVKTAWNQYFSIKHQPSQLRTFKKRLGHFHVIPSLS